MDRSMDVTILLKNAGFDEEVIKTFRANKVDRSVFVELDKDDMKELGITALGDRKKLQGLIVKIRKEDEAVHALPASGSFRNFPPLLCVDTDPGTLSDHTDNSEAEVSSDGVLSHTESFTTPNDLSQSVDTTCTMDSLGNASNLSQSSSQEPVEPLFSVPDTLDGWEEDFIVPTQFCSKTMGILASGSMSTSARAEIVQMTCSRMLNFCKYPKRRQYEAVARKIVSTLLNGKKDQTGDGYGSWTMSLETRFRNLRRKPRSNATGLNFIPPSKKTKLDQAGNHSCTSDLGVILDEETYQSHVRELAKLCSKKTRNKAAIFSLMKESFSNRRKWILEEKPTVSAVLERFPPLGDFDALILDFVLISAIEDPVQTFHDNWKLWVPKLFYKAKLEAQTQKKTFSHILSLVNDCADKSAEEICKHPDAPIVLLLLRKFFNRKMSKTFSEFLIILEDGDDIEKVISENQTTTPYIVQVGPESTRQWFITVEKEIVICVEAIESAVVAMMAYYYIFDIAYPKQWNTALLFIEKVLLGLKEGPQFNATQLGIISDIEQVL